MRLQYSFLNIVGLLLTEKTIRIATRQSPLALWQAEHVAALLEQTFPGVKTN